MAKPNPLQEKSPLYDRFRVQLVNYTDMIIRSLISFFFIGLGLYIILIGIFKWSILPTLLMAFFVSILVNPFLSKIKLGERIWSKYEKWLARTFR